MNDQMITMAYAVYLPIAIALTLYVAHILFKNSKVFMRDIFKGKMDIAMSTNSLFKIGFYLMNIGFALLILKIYSPEYNPIDTAQEMIETLSYKVGGFSIYLGIMLFLNMFMFFRGRKLSRQSAQQNVRPNPITIVEGK